MEILELKNMNVLSATGVNSTGHQNINNYVTTNPYDANSSTITGWDMYYPKTLVGATVTEETVELKYIQRARYSYTQGNFTIGGPNQIYTPDIALKEIYGIKDGKMTLLKTVTGRVVPPQEIPESIEFDDEIDE